MGKRGEEKGKREGRHSGKRGMSNVFSSKPHTMFHTFVHPLSIVAKGVDHVPVSHHAAVAALSKASHYSTG